LTVEVPPVELERVLFILCGATGMRIGEVLGLEIDKHFADDFTTILVRQQAKGSTLTSDVKTKNAILDIDVHPELAGLLRVTDLYVNIEKEKP